MDKESIVELNIWPETFVAIYTLLQNIRLGDTNQYEQAISNFIIALESTGTQEVINNWLKINDCKPPSIKVEASWEDGVTIILEESI
jgi:hypothetical protein